MADVAGLLRKASIERLSSPEQLDTPMRVTSPAGWIALSALGVLVLAAVAWGFLGNLPQKVDGDGILLRGSSVPTVQAGAAGVVHKILVHENQEVAPGQVLIRISMPETEGRIEILRTQVRELEAKRAGQAGAVGAVQAGTLRMIAELESRRAKQQSLVNRGLATQKTVLEIDGQINQLRMTMLQTQGSSVDVSSQLETKRAELREEEQKLELASVVVSPIQGQVVAILVNEGQMVAQSARLVNLEPRDAPFQVLGYVPGTEGKRIEKGMEVKISPSGTRSEEDGFILGRVDSVSAQVITPEELKARLNNEKVVSKYLENMPFEVRITPVVDPAHPSGFRWTGKGPPKRITGGTPTTIQVLVQYRRPYELVIPTVKKSLGLV